jgi:hypothetical protein
MVYLRCTDAQPPNSPVLTTVLRESHRVARRGYLRAHTNKYQNISKAYQFGIFLM